jgi:hypothetical protein
MMQRDLNLGGFDFRDIGTIASESLKFNDASVALLATDTAAADSVYFNRGATMDGGAAKLGIVRVSGDMTGFRTVTAPRVNNAGFGTDGSVTTDRATVTRKVNIGNDLILKSNSVRMISGFAGMTVHSLMVPFLMSDEIFFMDTFGLTVSAELLLSYDGPLKLGAWRFPSGKPKFTALNLSRGEIAAAPDTKEFDSIMGRGWKDKRKKS